jgi:glutathione S-transferase
MSSASKAGELVFYTNPMSRGRIVRWMLEEVGAPYRTELLEFGTTMKSPAYLAINPMGKVPAIRHGDTVVTEGAAICAYLADAFPAAGLAPPPGDRLRGPYYRWLFFAAGPLEAAVTNKAFGFEVPPERRVTAGYGTLADTLATLEAAVSGRSYLAGERFTAVDLYVGSHLEWGMQFGTIDKRPAFESYVARVAQRPAAVRAKQIDDELMAKAKQPV